MPWPILLLIATLKFRRGWCPTALYGQTKSWLLELMDQAGTFLGILNQAINGKCDIMSDVKWNGKAPAPAGSWHSPRLLLSCVAVINSEVNKELSHRICNCVQWTSTVSTKQKIKRKRSLSIIQIIHLPCALLQQLCHWDWKWLSSIQYIILI